MLRVAKGFGADGGGVGEGVTAQLVCKDLSVLRKKTELKYFVLYFENQHPLICVLTGLSSAATQGRGVERYGVDCR